MKLSELTSGANEIFSSITVFCPEFPPEAQTSVTKKFNQLLNILEALSAKLTQDDSKQWLRICWHEVHESQKYYDAGQRMEGMNEVLPIV
jgi:hypothetical protein